MSIIIVARSQIAVLCYSVEGELNRLLWALQTTHYFMTSPEDNKIVNALPVALFVAALPYNLCHQVF